MDLYFKLMNVFYEELEQLDQFSLLQSTFLSTNHLSVPLILIFRFIYRYFSQLSLIDLAGGCMIIITFQMWFFAIDNIVVLGLELKYHQAQDFQMILHYPKVEPLNLLALQTLHNGVYLHFQ